MKNSIPTGTIWYVVRFGRRLAKTSVLSTSGWNKRRTAHATGTPSRNASRIGVNGAFMLASLGRGPDPTRQGIGAIKRVRPRPRATARLATDSVNRPTGQLAVVITPRSVVAVMERGW